jgi:integrase
MYRGALRAAEVLRLKPADVDTMAGTVAVLNGKGGGQRVVGIGGEASALLARWLDQRRTLGLNGRHPIFSTLKGRRLATSYLRKLLPRLARQAGIERRVHPHILRHTRAAELAAEGIPMNVIKDSLGHSNLAVTSDYLSHIAPTEVIAAMNAAPWHPGDSAK